MNRYTLIGSLILLSLWAIVSGFSLINRFFLATPWDIALTLAQLSISGKLFSDLLSTNLRCIVSFIISILIGVPVGLFVGWSKLFRDYLSFPLARPYVFVGLRNALSLALIATIVAEMTMPGSNGLGYATLNAYQTFRIPQMYAYILVTGLVGWILNSIFLSIERHQLHWVQD
jgi:ABC-type nitrate/sulfonate/bicarbonate transport system permease component